MTVWVLCGTAQSNGVYPGRGSVYSNAAVKLFFYNPTSGDTSGDVWVDMVGATVNHGGYMATIVAGLIAAGVPASSIRVEEYTYGSSAYNRWNPLGPYLAPDILAHRATALAGLRDTSPGETDFRFIHIRNQGTTDMQIDNLSYQQGWAAGTDLWHEALEAQNVANGFRRFTAKICVKCFSGLDLSYQRPAVERQQLTWVGGMPLADTSLIGRHPRLVETEDARAFDADGTHGKAAAVVIDGVTYPGGGYHWMGTKILPAVLGIINMGTTSTYTRNAIADQARNKATAPIAATQYVHLYGSGGTPLTNGNAPGYAVFSFTNNQTSWPDAVGLVKTNGIAWVFNPSGTGIPVEEIRLTDSATEGAGHVLASDTFSPVAWNTSGGAITVPIGGFTITFASPLLVGGATAAALQPVVNRMFGAVNNSPLTTVHACWINGDPNAGGSAAGARVAVTLASTWGAATGGVATNTAAISLPHQGLGTYYAEYDASSGGTLLYACPRGSQGPTVLGADGVIPPGSLILQAA